MKMTMKDEKINDSLLTGNNLLFHRYTELRCTLSAVLRPITIGYCSVQVIPNVCEASLIPLSSIPAL